MARHHTCISTQLLPVYHFYTINQGVFFEPVLDGLKQSSRNLSSSSGINLKPSEASMEKHNNLRRKYASTGLLTFLFNICITLSPTRLILAKSKLSKLTANRLGS